MRNRLSNLFVLVSILVLALVLVAPAKAGISDSFYDGSKMYGKSLNLWQSTYDFNTYLQTKEGAMRDLSLHLNFDPKYLTATFNVWMGGTKDIGPFYTMSASTSGGGDVNGKMFEFWGNLGKYDDSGKGIVAAGEDSLISQPVPQYWATGNAGLRFSADGISYASMSGTYRPNDWQESWSGVIHHDFYYDPTLRLGFTDAKGMNDFVSAASAAGIVVTSVPEPAAMLLGFAPLLLLVRRPIRRPVLCNS